MWSCSRKDRAACRGFVTANPLEHARAVVDHVADHVNRGISHSINRPSRQIFRGAHHPKLTRGQALAPRRESRAGCSHARAQIRRLDSLQAPVVEFRPATVTRIACARRGQGGIPRGRRSGVAGLTRAGRLPGQPPCPVPTCRPAPPVQEREHPRPSRASPLQRSRARWIC